MKIFIDNSPLTQSVCGVQRYAECIIPRLVGKLPEGSVKLCPVEAIIEFYKYQGYFDESLVSNFNFYDRLVSKAYCHLKDEVNAINKYIKESSVKRGFLQKKVKREGLRFSKDLMKIMFFEKKILREAIKDVDIYHILYNYFPDEIKKSSKIKRFITVHDIIPAVRPDLIVQSKKTPFQKQIQQFKELSNQEVIFTDSEYSKQDLCNFNRNVDPANVHVTLLAASDSFKKASDSEVQQVRIKFKIPNQGRYILSTLTGDPKKNMPRVVAAFEELLDAEKLQDLYLVLFGSLKTADLSVINKLPSRIKDKVILPGYVDDEEVSFLHSGALCFCFPSLYEGFGIPVLEAMQCGAPVITSNVSSLPEVAGDAAILVDPLDTSALCQAFLNLYNDRELCQILSLKGIQHAKSFTWDACVDKMIEVYKAHSSSSNLNLG
ncbi:hypothetical protein AYO37_00600 [Opitutia bacterium SCGC AG-212-L18]|nr:hypothetical protein AYO37_00600 [Opitutae bacterium SCGC AG-212-L18]